MLFLGVASDLFVNFKAINIGKYNFSSSRGYFVHQIKNARI